jgi:DNA-binding MarR family transcriptional regulator
LTPKKKSRIKSQLRELHAAIFDLVALMNQPERDESTFKEAGVSLDRGLYALLSAIERFGPIGVVDLADSSGRDYTTVSRQVTKLVELGLVKRRSNPTDARVHEAMLTKRGSQTADALAAARQRIAAPVLDRWSDRNFSNLVRLVRRLVDDLEGLEPETGVGQRAHNTKPHRPRLG